MALDGEEINKHKISIAISNPPVRPSNVKVASLGSGKTAIHELVVVVVVVVMVVVVVEAVVVVVVAVGVGIEVVVVVVVEAVVVVVVGVGIEVVVVAVAVVVVKNDFILQIILLHTRFYRYDVHYTILLNIYILVQY